MFLLLLAVHVGSFGVACLPRQDVHLWVHTGPAHHPRHLSSPALPPAFSRSVIDPGAAALGRAALFSRAQLFSEPWRIYGRWLSGNVAAVLRSRWADVGAGASHKVA